MSAAAGTLPSLPVNPVNKLLAHRRSRRQSLIEVPHRVTPGAPPGQLRPVEDAVATTVSVFAYGPDGYVEEPAETLADIAAVRQQGRVAWINVDGVKNLDLIRGLGEMFGLHPLALEDVLNLEHRPKFEAYDSAQFFVLRMPRMDNKGLVLEQVSMFVGKDFVITVQEQPGDCLEPVRERIRHGKGRIRKRGVDYLAYAIIDAIVDHYFPVLEHYGDEIEDLETEVLIGNKKETISEVYLLRGDLLALRRSLWPLREALGRLTKGDSPAFGEETRIFLRDCYDHVVQLVDILETRHDMMSSLVDLHLSALSQRMNETMKVLTLIATVFMPLSFIAGLYGMNFDTSSPYNMPELGFRYGYLVVVAIMAVIGGGFLVFFRRKGWL